MNALKQKENLKVLKRTFYRVGENVANLLNEGKDFFISFHLSVFNVSLVLNWFQSSFASLAETIYLVHGTICLTTL